MQYVIYTRKSTESEDRQVQSLEDQLNVLRALSEHNGHKISQVISESKSAKDPYSRPEFEKLMLQVDGGKIAGIYTWSLNRLSRNLVDGGRLAHALQVGKIGALITPSRTYTSEDSALLLAVENGMATAYIQDLRRNVSRGMDGKAARGWLPAKAPMGYKNNAETREIDPHPVSFNLVRKVFELAATGHYSFAELRAEANQLGLRSTRKGHHGEPISKSGLHKILGNPFYAGLLAYKGRLTPGKHQPMITQALFDQVQTVLRRKLDVRKPEPQFALSGGITCKACGCAVVGELKSKTLADGMVRVYTYYHCSGAKGCKRSAISEEQALRQVASHLMEVAIPPDVGAWILRAMAMIVEDETLVRAQSASVVEADCKALEGKLERLLALRLDGELDQEEYATQKSVLRHKLETLRETARKASSAVAALLDYGDSRIKFAVEAFSYGNSFPTVFLRNAIRTGFQSAQMQGSTLVLAHDPVLQKIASFEPLRNGSQYPEQSDLYNRNSVWWTLVHDIRTIAHAELGYESNQESDSNN